VRLNPSTNKSRPVIPVQIKKNHQSTGTPHEPVIIFGRTIRGDVHFGIVLGIIFIIISIIFYIVIGYGIYTYKGINFLGNLIGALFLLLVVTGIFILGIYAVFASSAIAPSKLYKNGVIPPSSDIKDMFAPKYFIPFSETMRIGRVWINNRWSNTFYFLLLDGRIAKCDIENDSKFANRLERFLKRHYPNIEWIRLSTRDFNASASPVRYFADPEAKHAVDFEWWTPPKRFS